MNFSRSLSTRNTICLLTALTLFFGTTAMTQETDQVKPPVAKRVPHVMGIHGHERTDEYFWLKERENQEVIDYLNAENDYTKAVMADYQAGVDQIFEETKARIKQDDSSVPYDDRGFTYYVRYEEGKQYPIHCRKPVGKSDAPEQVILNVNELAEGQSFCRAAGLRVSNDCLLYTSPSPRDATLSRMPSSA